MAGVSIERDSMEITWTKQVYRYVDNIKTDLKELETEARTGMNTVINLGVP